MPQRLDGQGTEFRSLSESADAREDLAAIPRRDSGCPYRGLLPFDQDDAAVFFGRQRLTAELVVKLAGPMASIVAITFAPRARSPSSSA